VLTWLFVKSLFGLFQSDLDVLWAEATLSVDFLPSNVFGSHLQQELTWRTIVCSKLWSPDGGRNSGTEPPAGVFTPRTLIGKWKSKQGGGVTVTRWTRQGVVKREPFYNEDGNKQVCYPIMCTVVQKSTQSSFFSSHFNHNLGAENEGEREKLQSHCYPDTSSSRPVWLYYECSC